MVRHEQTLHQFALRWALAATVTVVAVVVAACLFLAPAQAAAAETEDVENTVNARQTADNSFLYDTSIYELTVADASYQGNTVQVLGEVVGDSINAEEDPGKVWITLESHEANDESSISVLVNKSTVALIDTYGGYNRTGTTLQVRGTFYLACPSHEGIMDIHAESVTLVAKGSETHEEFNLADFRFGAAFVVIGLVLALVYHFLRERER